MKGTLTDVGLGTTCIQWLLTSGKLAWGTCGVHSTLPAPPPRLKWTGRVSSLGGSPVFPKRLASWQSGKDLLLCLCNSPSCLI